MTDGKSDEGDTPREEDNPVSKVNKSYEELKAANDKVEEEMLRAEQLRTKIAQGGKSNAGSKQLSPEEELIKKAEETGKEISAAFE